MYTFLAKKKHNLMDNECLLQEVILAYLTTFISKNYTNILKLILKSYLLY